MVWQCWGSNADPLTYQANILPMNSIPNLSRVLWTCKERPNSVEIANLPQIEFVSQGQCGTQQLEIRKVKWWRINYQLHRTVIPRIKGESKTGNWWQNHAAFYFIAQVDSSLRWQGGFDHEYFFLNGASLSLIPIFDFFLPTLS